MGNCANKPATKEGEMEAPPPEISTEGKIEAEEAAKEVVDRETALDDEHKENPAIGEDAETESKPRSLSHLLLQEDEGVKAPAEATNEAAVETLPESSPSEEAAKESAPEDIGTKKGEAKSASAAEEERTEEKSSATH
ncbi:hypothetical protein Nepgr_026967 [Nepenthes gracilis]|uniref:Uncharacterized protein n=1 Tax=Nepenthes gracilis TaxID=150966 RepID=A0AAD3Y2M8_NEPGR|nr:hypothetical protein Nepgr_026967 [Nepenthes gracilis]